MCLSIGEQPIDDQSKNWEEEDDQTPEKFVGRRTVGFENLDEDNNIENQNDESNNSATRTIFPCITMSSNLNRLSKCQGEEEELKEEAECILEHVD